MDKWNPPRKAFTSIPLLARLRSPLLHSFLHKDLLHSLPRVHGARTLPRAMLETGHGLTHVSQGIPVEMLLKCKLTPYQHENFAWYMQSLLQTNALKGDVIGAMLHFCKCGDWLVVVR
jgi:hypothetical protein